MNIQMNEFHGIGIHDTNGCQFKIQMESRMLTIYVTKKIQFEHDYF
jgi:hypothetical protein